MQPVNELVTFHVEVWDQSRWESIFQSHPPYAVEIAAVGLFRKRVATIRNLDAAEEGALARATRIADGYHRREKVRIVKIKTTPTGEERTVVYRRNPSLI